MNINFTEILTRPFKQEKLFKNLFLLFLPAMLAAYTLGTDHWLFNVMHAIGLMTLYGYLCEVMQNEVEFDGEEQVNWRFLKDFFLGLKGFIFFLVNLALFVTLIFGIWLFIGNIPGFEGIMRAAIIICSLYWVFLYYSVSLGLFVQELNPVVALNIQTIVQIANSCLYDYFIAFIYMLIYTIFIGFFGWMFVSLFGSNFFLIEMFVVYGIVVYSLLYSEVFKEIREDFENYI